MSLTPQNASITAAKSADKAENVVGAALNNILGGKDDVLPDIVRGELSNAFTMLDPSLSALQDDLKKASLQLAEAKRKGVDVDMALWRFETAESAFQTRFYEVRKNSLIREIEENQTPDAKKELLDLTMQQRMNDEFNMLRQKRAEEKRRQEEKKSGGFFFYFMLGLILSNIHTQNLKRQMEASQLSNDFSKAKTA